MKNKYDYGYLDRPKKTEEDKKRDKPKITLKQIFQYLSIKKKNKKNKKK
tara:strand:+ start:328 stop:474 length:147 start_codon:yes stop_codon:yes gene_type:complete